MQKRILCYAVACLLSLNVFSQYIYEGNQSLVDLTNESNTTSLNSGDDQLSSAFNLDFTFNFYDKQFTSARMATNGCLHFGLGTGNVNYNNYCGDYTPDPLPQYNYTLFPFWTDLIRDNNSKMLAKNFSDKTVFGWYDMREYNRASDNSFEVILWTNSTFDFRYGDLDIIQHDVLIGQQKDSDTYYQYLFHDECNSGTTNTSSCVNKDWNTTTSNTLLEDGGSLYGTSETLDCSNPLNDVSCPGYWDAYDDLQCNLDPQYGPFCLGYRQEESVAYFQEEEQFDYGYEEEQFGYEEDQFGYEDPFTFEEYTFEQDYSTFEEPEYIYEEEIIFEQMFSQEEYRETFEPITEMTMREEEIFMPVDDLMIEEFIFQETFLVEDFREPETFIELETIEDLEEWFEEETRMEEEITNLEEPEEEFIEEIFEEEFVEDIFDNIEEQIAEAEIEEQLEREESPEEFEENFVEEFQAAEREESTGKSSITRELALSVISSAVTTAQNSISGTTSGTTIHATGGTTGYSSSTSSGSGGGISTSSSPSMSDQIASASVQTNQLLDMSFSASVDTSESSVDAEINSVSTSLSVDTTTTQTIQNDIDVSTSTGNTTSEADQVADKILAKNIQAAQEDVQTQQEETGEYGAEDTIIAYMGFVPDFNNYRIVTMPQKEFWYEPKSIYTNNTISDNNVAFYGLAGQSIRTLTELKQLQPGL